MHEICCPNCRMPNCVIDGERNPICWNCDFELKKLLFSIGSVVLCKKSKLSYIITNTINGIPVATRTISIKNRNDWELISSEEGE